MTNSQLLEGRVILLINTTSWLCNEIDTTLEVLANTPEADKPSVKELKAQLNRLKEKCEFELREGENTVDKILKS